MKLHRLGLLSVAILLGMAAVGSADTLGFNVGLEYTKSYDVNGNDLGQLPFSTALQPDGATKTIVNLGGSTGVIHQFEMFLSTHDLAADQDALYFQFNNETTGDVTVDGGVVSDPYVPSLLSVTPIDPPLMGSSATPPGMSNASPASPFWLNLCNADFTAWAMDVKYWGGTSSGNGNGTYGDYAAYLEVGEDAPYHIGTVYLTADDFGTFGFWFGTNPGKFKIISNNINGLGINTDTSYPPYVGRGDLVQFVPEPGTIVLLISGLLGMICYAWRKRK